MSGVKRRRLLFGVAAAGTSLAVATRLQSVLTSPERELPPTVGEIQTGGVGVVNRDSEPHAVTLSVWFDGDPVHRQDYRVGTTPGDRSVFVDDVPAEAGEFRVTVEMDGETAELRPPYRTDVSCTTEIFAFIERTGRLSSFFFVPCERTQTNSSG